MARRFGRSARIIQGQKRLTLWTQQTPLTDSIATASTAVLVSVLDATELALRPFTIVRTHLTFSYHSDQQAASEFVQIGASMSVVQKEASAIGITALPTPVTDMGSDSFFLFHMGMMAFEFGDATGFNSPADRLE